MLFFILGLLFGHYDHYDQKVKSSFETSHNIAISADAKGSAADKDLLDRAATLLPSGRKVVFLADRGFADSDLVGHLRRLHWHWRIRVKESFWIYRKGRPRCKTGRIGLAPGKALFWHDVFITGKRFGPVHLAMAKCRESKERWLVVSDDPTSLETFEQYGLRFDIEENFLDDKSNGFQLGSSLIRSADALCRLCFVLAITTLYLVSQGVEVVRQGKRRFVDPHWFRGSSYLKIGWNWVKVALTRGYELIVTLSLPVLCDPEPAVASKARCQKRSRASFQIVVENAA